MAILVCREKRHGSDAAARRGVFSKLRTGDSVLCRCPVMRSSYDIRDAMLVCEVAT